MQRDKFFIPPKSGSNNNAKEESIYLCGNSLGLQPKSVQYEIERELRKWALLGVEGHFKDDLPWVNVGEQCIESMSKIVGGLPSEVVIMNSLSVNLHILMTSFYRPTSTRFKIMIEAGAFPSDIYAAKSQIELHGYDPALALIQVRPRKGEDCLRLTDIIDTIKKNGSSLSLVLFSGVQYYTGQKFDMISITKAGHSVGAKVGFDLAHAAGNVELELHNWDVDFACWCSYKYLNSGPGGISGCFIHERHHANPNLLKLKGWWGNEKTTRFLMRENFVPSPDAGEWQLSNPPVLLIASLRASMSIFDCTSMKELVQESRRLTGYLEKLIDTKLPQNWGRIMTPRDPDQRGCQLSLIFKNPEMTESIFHSLSKQGIICDRRGDCIRVAPAPLYNTEQDIENFVFLLEKELKSLSNDSTVKEGI